MASKEVLARIQNEIDTNPVVVFMKGTKDQPMCGFSAQVVHILNQSGATFKDINVLDDYEVREGIKEFNNWPTIPQIFINGKFIGGCDIAVEMYRKGELKPLLESSKA